MEGPAAKAVVKADTADNPAAAAAAADADKLDLPVSMSDVVESIKKIEPGMFAVLRVSLDGNMTCWSLPGNK